MPIYEYRCESCGVELEKIRKFSDPPLTDCPACGKPTLKKLVSASSFRLKGSGWYETDFKNKKKPAGDGKASQDGGGDGGKDGSTDRSADRNADKDSDKAAPGKPADAGKSSAAE